MTIHQTALTKRTVDEEGNESSQELHFFYDSQSKPAFVEFEGERYRYVHSLQGDIIGIVDSSGNTVVEYKYDAWGKTTLTDSVAYSIIGDINPLRYRGYAYEKETELYYLRTRYYNCSCVRFINADIQIHTELPVSGTNLFHYCHNMPTACCDSDGNDGKSLNGMTGVLVFLKDDEEITREYLEENYERILQDPVILAGHIAAIYDGTVYSYGPAENKAAGVEGVVTIMKSYYDVIRYMESVGSGGRDPYKYCYYMPIEIPNEIDLPQAKKKILELKDERLQGSSKSKLSKYKVKGGNLEKYNAMTSNCVSFVLYCYKQLKVKLSGFSGASFFPRMYLAENKSKFKRIV